MFDFLKKRTDNKPAENQNDFLNIENSAFNMQSESQSFSDNPNYQSLVYQEPVYDVPKYKAGNLNNLGVVVDSDAIGFDKNTINPNIKTIEIPNNEDEPQGTDIISEPIITEKTEPVELIDIMDPINDFVIPPLVEDNSTISLNIPLQDNSKIPEIPKESEEVDKISLFGSNDGFTNVNKYSSLNQFEEEKKELIKEVDYTKDGYKICPNCGAILNPNAPVCFMCSKSFVLKK